MSDEYVSKLDDGCIPAKTECPWKNNCGLAQDNTCHHLGVNHTVPYSCAMARSFNLSDELKHNKRLKMLKDK